MVSLEKKVDDRQIKEIQEILEKQKVIEKVISANSDAIQQLDEELRKKVKDIKVLQTSKETLEKVVDDDGKEKKKVKVCRYFNRGFGKYKN